MTQTVPLRDNRAALIGARIDLAAAFRSAARLQMHEGQATFVPAGAEHQFVGYEQLSLLVIFEKTPKS